MISDIAIACSVPASAVESYATQFGQIRIEMRNLQAQLCQLQASSGAFTGLTALSCPVSGALLPWILDSWTSFHVTSDAT